MKFFQNLFSGSEPEKDPSGTQPDSSKTETGAPVTTFEGRRFRLCSTVNELCEAIHAEDRGILKFQSMQYSEILGELKLKLESEFQSEPRYASDLFASPLVCAGCLWQFPPSYILSLQAPDLFGGKLFGATAGFNTFGKSGVCPQCGSEQDLLVYEFFRSEDISQADVDAIQRYWRSLAQRWWQQQNEQRSSAICDHCNSDMRRGEGYLLGSNLNCETCVRQGLMAEGLEMLKKNPHYYGVALLRKVRNYRGTF